MLTLPQIMARCPPNVVQIFVKPDTLMLNPPLNGFESPISLDSLPHILNQILFTNQKEVHLYEFINNEYVLSKQGTPHNFDEFYEYLDQKVIAALDLQNTSINLCFYKNNIIYACDFVDNDIFSNLYAVLFEIGATDVYYNDQSVQKVLLSAGVNAVEYNGKKKKALEMIADVLKIKEHALIYENEGVESDSESKNVNRIQVRRYTLNSFMKLNASVLESLNLTNEGGLFTKTIVPYTVHGKRLLLQFLKQPLIEEFAIRSRQMLVQYLFYCKKLDPVLKQLSDLKRFSRRLVRLNVEEILALDSQLKCCNNLIEAIVAGSSRFGNHFPRYQNTCDKILDSEINRFCQDIYYECRNTSNPQLLEHNTIQISESLRTQILNDEDTLQTSNNNLAPNNNPNHQLLSPDLLKDHILSKIARCNAENILHPILEVVETEILQPLSSLLTQFDTITTQIAKSIDINTSEILTDATSVHIDRKKQILHEIDQELAKFMTYNKKIKLELKDGIYYFKITRNEYKSLKQYHVIEKSILKTGVLFSTKNLVNLNNDLQHVDELIKSESKVVLDMLRLFLNDYRDSIEAYNYLVSMIDVLYCFSKLRDKGYTFPLFLTNLDALQSENQSESNLFADKDSSHVSEPNNEQDISQMSEAVNKDDSSTTDLHNTPKTFELSYLIRDCKHPLIMNCIPNSLSLTKKKFCSITGPNMGGKSTFLKQIAISQILAQIGCLVPCELAVLPIIKSIQIRLGTNDNIFKNESTFMAEMKDIALITRQACKDSLILIDELGRGTNSVDGLSISLGIRDFLINKGCITLFATHFSEICSSDIVNLRVKKQIVDNNLVMLYEIEKGVCDVSYGIKVAEKVGFPPEVIEDAQNMLKSYN